MKMITWLFGDKGNGRLDQAKVVTEAAIAAERGRLNNAVQGIKSGSRVLENMAGMLNLMTLNEQIRDDR